MCGEQMLRSAVLVDGSDGASRLVGGTPCCGTTSLFRCQVNFNRYKF